MSDLIEVAHPTPFEQRVEALKRKYPNTKLVLIEVESGVEGEMHEFILKHPDRKIMCAVAKLAHSDPFQSVIVLIDNCLVSGEKSLLEDITIFSAVSEKFENAIQAKKATIKNL